MIFLGCDGGSTKTEWLLVDHTGQVLAHRIFPGCNFAFWGEDGFRDLMVRSVQTLLADSGITSQQITSAMLSLTVYGEVPGTEEFFPQVMQSILPDCPLQFSNDSVAGWCGSLAGRPGINIVAGTGSVAYGQDSAGNASRVGGWSLFFADEGSCSWVARQMITEFVKQADGRHPRSAIYEELRQELSITHDLYFSGYLQTNVRQDSSLLAKLQLVVLRAAQRGDPAAIGIYHRAAEELTEMATAIRQQLTFSAGETVPVSYSGGGDSRYPGSQGSSVIKVFDMTIATTGVNEKTAKQAGIDCDKVYLSPMSHAGYYPGGKVMTLKVVFEKGTYRLLGAQIVGYEGVDKRIDVLATAIHAGLSALQLKDLDLAYAPPYSSAKDPVNMAGFMIENLSHGLVEQFFPEDVDALPRDGSVTLLDVRTPGEYADGHAEGFVNLPVDDLRERLREVPVGKPVYVICQSGLRSYIACRILAQQGFKCYNLSGGWRLYETVVRDRTAAQEAWPCGMEK